MNAIDAVAHEYVRLTLAVGAHDKDYVDAYYGPAELRAEVEARAMPLTEIRSAAVSALEGLEQASHPTPSAWGEASLHPSADPPPQGEGGLIPTL
ncbi:hypothetical protein EON82_17855, partial [bacterium]